MATDNKKLLRLRTADIWNKVRKLFVESLLIILTGLIAAEIAVYITSVFETELPIEKLTLAVMIAVSVTVLVYSLTVRLVADRVTRSFSEQLDSLTAELSRLYISTSSVEEIAREFLSRIMRSFDLPKGSIMVFKNRSIYAIEAEGYAERPSFLWADMNKFMAAGPLLAIDAADPGAQELFEKYQVALSLPLSADLEWVGLLLLDEPRHRDSFLNTELNFLALETPRLALALRNAISYEEAQSFTQVLKIEVDQKTRQLQNANVHLRELDEAKDEFLSLASHQLRTPLTTIKGYLSMLLEGDAGKLTDKQKRFANESFGSSQQMSALINDLLNVSRMEAGKFFIELSTVDLKAVVDEEVELLNQRAKDRGIKIIYQQPETPIPVTELDEGKTRQVIINLIDNALLYTKEGSIAINLTADAKEIVFTVSDTGIGIPKKEMKSIFQKFFRAENARRDRPDGTGLGLYLAKRVIEDQGGSMIVTSQEGKGSTIGFRLPIIRPKIAHDKIIEGFRNVIR